MGFAYMFIAVESEREKIERTVPTSGIAYIWIKRVNDVRNI